MNPKSLIHLLLASLIACTFLNGCGSSNEDPVGGVDKEVTVKAVSTAPNLADIVNDPVWDDVDVASIRVGADSTFTDYFGVGIVRVQAIQDGEYVYMRFNWSDSSKSDSPARWLFDRPGALHVWSQALDTVKNKFGNFAYSATEKNQQRWENEDVLALFFDMEGSSANANCALTCHMDVPDSTLPTHYTQGNGPIDSWIWRAGRTGSFGIAEDYCWRDNSKYDAFDIPLYVRNSKFGTYDEDDEPRLMHTNGGNYEGALLLAPDTVAMQLLEQGWATGKGVSGYVYFPNFKDGQNSRYDVSAKSEYDPQLGRWNLVLWRKLVAPNASDDVTFEVGHSYDATLAIMKNTLQRHSGSQPFTIKF